MPSAIPELIAELLGTAGAVVKRFTGGEAADVVVTATPLMGDLVKGGNVDAAMFQRAWIRPARMTRARAEAGIGSSRRLPSGERGEQRLHPGYRYRDTGGPGQPVILLHAGTHSAAGWVYQQPVLAQAGYRVIAYSRRGYYRSDTGDLNNPGVGSDDLHCLIQHLKLDKAHLVSAAQGGFFAIDYALEYPGKVRSLAVISSYMGITDADYAVVNARLRRWRCARPRAGPAGRRANCSRSSRRGFCSPRAR